MLTDIAVKIALREKVSARTFPFVVCLKFSFYFAILIAAYFNTAIADWSSKLGFILLIY